MSDKSVFRLRDLIKPAFDLWLISWLLGLITVFAVVGLLMVSGWFISATALAGMVALGSHAFNYMMPAAIIRMLAMTRTAGRYGELMVSHHAVFSLLKALRLTFFKHLAKSPILAQKQALSSGQLMHRLVSDIDRLDEFVLRVVSPWLFASTLALGLSGLLWWWLPFSMVSKLLIVATLFAAVLLPIVAAFVSEPLAHALADRTERRREELLNPLSILTQLVLWQQWHIQSQAFLQQDDEHFGLEQHAEKTRARLKLAISILLSAGIVVVLALLFRNILPFDTTQTLPISIPLLLAVVLGILGLNEIVLPLGQHYLAWGNSVVAKSRLNTLLAGQPKQHATASASINAPSATTATQVASNGEQKLALPTAPFSITLHEVTAKYPDALWGASRVTAHIQSGRPLLVKGVSGSGKTTLLQALAGELPVLAGDITLNQQAWTAYDWQDQLGYLGQQLDIFDQTLAVNLRLGKANASEAELMMALEKVGLKHWAMDLPQGLATPLGEYGMAVSGGQARRIALARLLLKPRKVLLFDEPFAGLDEATRRHVWASLTAHQQQGVLILVSHQTWAELLADCDTLVIEPSPYL